jgi:hypothetical protein
MIIVEAMPRDLRRQRQETTYVSPEPPFVGWQRKAADNRSSPVPATGGTAWSSSSTWSPPAALKRRRLPDPQSILNTTRLFSNRH